MGNEDKILALLENLVNGQARIEADVADLKQGQAKLEQGQTKLEQGQAKLEQRVSRLEDEIIKVKVLLENEVQPSIRLLAEGHGQLVRKVDYLTPIAERLEEDVETIKSVVTSHSHKINTLQPALV